MDKKLIYELIEKIENSKLTKFEYESDDFKIVLEKNNSGVNVTPQIESMSQSPNVVNEPVVNDNIGNVVKSPIVGTFYASPAPGEEPFVNIGKAVKKGDVICIIEAMKVMNEIESEFDGEVIEISVQNGQLVEFGQPIIKVK